MMDWNIHKKLLDGGGLGPVVYVMPGRANGKTWTEWRMLEKLLTEGRTVVYGQSENRKVLLGARQPWVLLDRDILTPECYERADRMWNELWKERRE